MAVVRLYQVDVDLLHDGNVETRAGTAVVAVPFEPTRPRFLGTGAEPEGQCREINRMHLRRMLALPGARSASLATVLAGGPTGSASPSRGSAEPSR